MASAMPPAAFQTVLAAEYSSLFSSGLLAAPLARASADRDRTPVSSPAPSPSASPAPIRALGSPPVPLARDRERSTTPTPTNPHPGAPPAFLGVTPTSSPMLSPALPSSPYGPLSPASGGGGGRPGLRKRKSSLSLAQAASPRAGMKSQTRPGILGARARGSSVVGFGDALRAVPEMQPRLVRYGSDGAPGAASLLGRMRSGSLGGAIRAGARRLVRKAPTAPPSAPLPPVPTLPPLPPSTAALTSPSALLPAAPLSADGAGAASAPLAYANPFAPARGPALKRPLARRAQTDAGAPPMAASAANPPIADADRGRKEDP